MRPTKAPCPNERTDGSPTLLAAQITADGFSPSPLPGVEYMRAVVSTPRHPIVYTPRIVVIAQGHKRVWLGEKEFVYDPEHLLVLSVPMPFECQTTASKEEPLLGLAIGVDPILVGELLLEMGDAANAEPSSYVSSTAIDPEVMDAAVRLAETLGSSADCRIIGPQIVREIVYRVLTGEQGDVLRLLIAQPNRHGQIARVLRRIHADYADELDVPLVGARGEHGDLDLPPRLQGRHRDLTAAVREEHPPAQGAGASGRRRAERAGRGAPGRLRERLPVQPGVPPDVRLQPGFGSSCRPGMTLPAGGATTGRRDDASRAQRNRKAGDVQRRRLRHRA